MSQAGQKRRHVAWFAASVLPMDLNLRPGGRGRSGRQGHGRSVPRPHTAASTCRPRRPRAMDQLFLPRALGPHRRRGRAARARHPGDRPGRFPRRSSPPGRSRPGDSNLTGTWATPRNRYGSYIRTLAWTGSSLPRSRPCSREAPRARLPGVIPSAGKTIASGSAWGGALTCSGGQARGEVHAPGKARPAECPGRRGASA